MYCLLNSWVELVPSMDFGYHVFTRNYRAIKGKLLMGLLISALFKVHWKGQPVKSVYVQNVFITTGG